MSTLQSARQATHEWSTADVVGEIAKRADAWRPPEDHLIGLAGGSAGTALLFVELSKQDPGLRPAAHARLAAAARTIGSAPDSKSHGLHDGLTGLAFAIKASARAPGDYATVLAQMNAFLSDRLRHLLDLEHDRLADGTTLTSRVRFDVVNGATGLARYFLAEPADPDPVREVLRYLVALTRPIHRGGRTLPGWTAPPWPGRDTEDDLIDTGLAHGIAGPLALLSLCWTRGLRVPGHDTAIRHIADWLMARRLRDDSGPYWPAVYSVQEELAEGGPQQRAHRPSWCYGTPGISRAMQLAGMALGEEEWVRSAADAMHAVYRRPDSLTSLEDPGLCHGLAGLAHITRVVASDLGDPTLTNHATTVTEALRANFDPDTAFGYPTRTTPTPHDAPTFLDGAAGVALALLGPDTPPHWHAALLLA